MNESNLQIAEQATTSRPILAALGALIAITAVMSLGGSPLASAQDRMATPSSVQGATMHDGVDWARVSSVPASPAQSIAAYDR